MKKTKEKKEIPKNIATLIILISLIFLITGTWMAFDKPSGLEAQENKIIGKAQDNIALNIEYDDSLNKTKEKTENYKR